MLRKQNFGTLMMLLIIFPEMKFVDVKFLPRQKKEEIVTIRIEAKLKDRLERQHRV